MKVLFRKFLIFVLFVFFGFVQPSFSQTPNQEQLTKIENEIWGFSYENEGDLQRTERIEKQIFGTLNPKINLEKRIDKISKTLGIETYEEAKSSLSELYVPEQAGAGVEYPQIDELEGALLGSVYKNENIYARLERLEMKVFGAKQEGDLDKRTEALKNSTNIAQKSPFEYQNAKRQAPIRQTPSYSAYNESDTRLQLSAIENTAFGMDFSGEPTTLRLNRLENRIFQRNFEDDDESTRIERLQAAASAKKTAKYYDNNKFQKFTSTGLQAASFILMILALIL